MRNTVYWSLAGCTGVPRPGISGGLWLGGASREPLQGARGYAHLTTIFGSCLGSGGSNSE
jgi:hypothetical protein